MSTAMAPESVSLVEGNCVQPYNRMPLIHTNREEQTEKSRKNNFTVCVTPINNHYNDKHRFIEMIEMNRILGADMFILYNYSIGNDVTSMIRTYNKHGKIKILVKNWHLPENSKGISLDIHENWIHYVGQLAALNDCLYLTKSTSVYTVFTDLDEFVVPNTRYENWIRMLSHLNKYTRLQNYIGAYIFRNVFFPTQYESHADSCMQHGNGTAAISEVKILCKIKRYKEEYPHGIR